MRTSFFVFNTTTSTRTCTFRVTFFDKNQLNFNPRVRLVLSSTAHSLLPAVNLSHQELGTFHSQANQKILKRNSLPIQPVTLSTTRDSSKPFHRCPSSTETTTKKFISSFKLLKTTIITITTRWILL